MASKAVVEAVEARLGPVWNGLAVYSPNSPEGETPADAAQFLQLQFPLADAERMSISNRLYRETGGFRVIINGERGAGVSQILTWAEQLMTLFRDVTFDGVKCEVPSPPFLDDSNENGSYFKASIVVPYTYDFIS